MRLKKKERDLELPKFEQWHEIIPTTHFIVISKFSTFIFNLKIITS